MFIPVWACIHLLKFVWKVAVAFDDQYAAFLWTKEQILADDFERFCFVTCSRKVWKKVEWWLAARYVVWERATPPSILPGEKKRSDSFNSVLKGPSDSSIEPNFLFLFIIAKSRMFWKSGNCLEKKWVLLKRSCRTSVLGAFQNTPKSIIYSFPQDSYLLQAQVYFKLPK